MNRFGKKRTYIAGLMLLVPLFSLTYFLPKNMNVHELYGLMAFIGFAIGGVYVRS
jgi:Na+/melibiose symporter-like transporter